MKTSNNKYVIENNIQIADGIFKMILSGDCSSFVAPGQFINIEIDGLYLRRPISISDYDEKSFTIIYKVVGEGTRVMSLMRAGKELSILAPLGNGYDLKKIHQTPLIVGGGVGIPPMYGLVKRLLQEDKLPTVVLGFNSIKDIYYVDEFIKLKVNVFVTTVDGSRYNRGFVTDLIHSKNSSGGEVSGILATNFETNGGDGNSTTGINELVICDFDYVCACGPEPMLEALSKIDCEGQFSFESRMGCGFGACMGCSKKTRDGYKRICKEGPVLFKSDVY